MSALHARKVIDFEALKSRCTACSLRELCLPVGIDRASVERLESIIARGPPIPKGGHVFKLGDRFASVYAVRSGSVKTYTVTEDGGEQVTGFHLPGELIGLDAIGRERHACGARSLETTTVCEMPYARLDELIVLVPALGRQLVRILSRELGADDRLVTLLAKSSAEQRLATLLVSLSARLGERGYSRDELRLSMPRADIGNYLGLAVETVSRVFTRFQQQGILQVDGKRVRIVERERLRAVATSMPPKD